MASDDLPERWRAQWREMEAASPGEEDGYSVQEWLEETYFDGDKRQDLSKADIRRVGELISRLLWVEPGARASAKGILQDYWVKEW